MRFACLKLLLLAVVVSLLCAARLSAIALFSMVSFDDGTIIWEGTTDVKTSNNSVSPTNTDLYSNLGITDPAFLTIAFDWRNTSLDISGASIDISKIALILTLNDGACSPGDCVTPRNMLETEGFRLPDAFSTPNPIDLDRSVIPFYAILSGAPVRLQYPNDRFLFLLSAADQARLRTVIAEYGAAALHVGLAVNTQFNGSPSVFGQPTFEVRTTMPASLLHRAGDYDGDGFDDLTVFRPNRGLWFVLSTANGTATGTFWGLPADLPVPGDYDGDGKTDHAIYRPSNGAWFVLQSTTGSGVAGFWGVPGDQPVPADYDGDGKTDRAVYRPSNGLWSIIPSGTGIPYGVYWGVTGDLPVPADYDGDGKADPAVFRPSTNTWFEFRSTTGTGFAVTWGLNGDLPLAGDYDGDGKADPTVFRPSSGAWFQLRSTTGPTFGGHWGVPGDVPIVGDYDGDGKADLTVFRPSDNKWYQLRSLTGAPSAVTWALPGDIPM